MWKYLKLYRTIWRHFGFRLRPFGTFGLIQLRHLVNAATRGLDHVVAPGFRRLPIDRPVFIIGNPRSGTTFVHRFLLHTEALCAFELWEMLFPAITARKMLGGAVHRLARMSPARYHSSDAHETSLRDVETDDVLEFFQTVDGGFLWSYFGAWDDVWDSQNCRRHFDLTVRSRRSQDRLFRYLEGSWRRNMYAKKKPRIIAKTSLFTLRIETLLERYPDCKLIYIVRDPVQTIPSGLSLLTGVLEQSYDIFHATRPEDRGRYLENLYQASCHMYRAFEDVRARGLIPEKNLRIVPYPQLTTDLESTMEELVDFIEVSPPAEFYDQLRFQAEKQKNRKSAHQYSLEKFGLTEDRIRRDLQFVYQGYPVA